MKPFVLTPWLVIVLSFLTSTFAVIRFATVHSAPEIEFTFFNVYKDLAHIYIGLLIGFAFAVARQHDRHYLVGTGLLLIAVESLCAAATLLKG